MGARMLPWMARRMDEWTGGLAYGGMDGRVDRRIDGWMDGWIVGWWVDG